MTISRQLEVQYGKLYIGGSSPYKLHGNIVHTKSYPTYSVAFTFIIASSSYQDLTANMRKVEEGFRIPEQNLSIRQGNSTIIKLVGNHQSGSGARPVITRPDDIKWTGFARRYDVVISYDLQADNTPDTARWPHGLLDMNDSVEYESSGKAIITIAGTVTSLAGNSATDTYDSIKDDLVTAIEDQYTGRVFDSNPLSEAVNSNITNDRLTFSLTYKELIYDQSGTASASHDDTDIVNDSLTFSVSQNQPGNDARAQRFTEVRVSYSATVIKTVTDLKSKANAIKNWVINKVISLTGIQAEGLLDLHIDTDVVDNKIAVNLTVLGYSGASSGTTPITMTVVTERKIDDAHILVPVWDGNARSRFKFQGPITEIVTCTVQGRIKGSVTTGDQYLKVPSGTITRLNHSDTVTPLIIGQGNQTIVVTDIRTQASWQIYQEAAIPTITPGGGTSTGPVSPPLLEGSSTTREPVGAPLI